MKIDGVYMNDVQTIENNYDNIGILKVIQYLVGVVINDIEYMNDLVNEKEYYDLGNNYKIKNEDLESLCSILDTINDVIGDNGEYEY